MSALPSPLRLDLAFARRAEVCPDAVALVEGGGSTSYAALDRNAARLAALLEEGGIGPGDLVGLHLERGRLWVAATLAVLRSGAAVLPLPPSYPVEQRRGILAAARPVLVLASDDSPLREVSARGGSIEEPSSVTSSTKTPSLLQVSWSDDGMPSPPDPPRSTDGREGHPAFVLSSSGTTGRPKLIVRSHRSFFHRLGWTWRTLPFAPGEVGCQKAHQTTTHSIYELFEPLLAGVPTVIVPDPLVRDLEGFWTEVRSRGITRLLLVPSMLRATLDGGFTVPERLRAVILMGEAVSSELARRTLEAFPAETALYSIYGSTEASSVLVSDLRTARLDGAGLPLGTPIAPEIEARVLDAEGRPVGEGGSGRLHIAGPALFDGYGGDPELTSRVLREVDGARLFDTRDDVRIRRDGSLDFLGRTDHTVKIRGFRVDLLAVERTLRELPCVGEAVAVPVGGPGADSALHAFVTPETVDAAETLSRLRDLLPPHAVPSRLRALDELPRTSSGKIDRRRLGDAGRAGGEGWSDAGRSPEEIAVARVWSGVLGHDGFTAETSFFEAGGTSLSAFAVLQGLRAAFDVDPAGLGVTDLLADPTVAGLARRLSGTEDGGDRARTGMPGLVSLRSGRSREEAPLFVISAAGGTLGAYSRVLGALGQPRAVVGLEDPYLWGGRDAAEPFERWVDRFVEMIRHRQPDGPYQICAYSSAGAFAWEVTRRLEAVGDRVETLVLIDPMAIDSLRRTRWGFWAARCSYANRLVRGGAKVVGRARAPLARLAARISDNGGANGEAWPTPERVTAMVEGAVDEGGFLRRLATLMELDGGSTIPAFDTEAGDPGGPPVFDRFVEAVRAAHPQIDPVRLERIVRQYGVQVQYQRAYPLRPIRARVLLFEPETAYSGLLAGLIRPFAGTLESYQLPVGEPTPRQAQLLKPFAGWRTHYWCMRDDTFARGVAAGLDRYLPPPADRSPGSAP